MSTQSIRRVFDTGRSFWATYLIGVGLMSEVDEMIFHQILAWHHFYDRSTPAVALTADGLLHAFNLIALVGGFFLFADVRRRNALAPTWAWAGFFLGAGSFQLFDGLVDHKVLRLHQIRYGVELLPYDLAWNGFAVLLLLTGGWILHRAQASEGPRSSPP